MNSRPKITSIKIWNLANGTANGTWLEHKQVLKRYFKINAKPPRPKLVRK